MSSQPLEYAVQTFRLLDLSTQFLYPADLATLQPDLDAMGMGGRLYQDIIDHTLGEFSGTLLLLQDDPNLEAGVYSGTMDSSHTMANS